MPNKFKNKSKPIFRAEYHCLGGCNAEPPSEDSDNDSTTKSGLYSDDSDKVVVSIHNQLKETSIPKKTSRRSGQCPTRVKLHVSLQLIISDYIS